MNAGSGNDRVTAVNNRRDVIRCGASTDRVEIDRVDRVSGCERVTIPHA